MPSQPEYLTKADAARWFRRSERSISRDITNAIKAADRDVLAHVRLQLEDGTIRPGTDITIEEIIGLRDAGKNPTWEINHRWLASRYGSRGDVPQETAAADVLPPLPPNDEHHRRGASMAHELPTKPNLRLAVLEVVNAELEKRSQEKSDQIKRLEKELDRRAEERREETELQRQNNVLMQQVYDLLSKMHQSSGEVSLLAPDQEHLPHPCPSTKGVNCRLLPRSSRPPRRPERAGKGVKWSTKCRGRKNGRLRSRPPWWPRNPLR